MKTDQARHFVFSLLRVFGPSNTLLRGELSRVPLQGGAHDTPIRPQQELINPPAHRNLKVQASNGRSGNPAALLNDD